MAWNDQIRRQFPFIERRPGVSYLDSAATTQQPQEAIDAVRDAAMRGIGSVHRGLHPLSDESTDAFERARDVCSTFLGAEYSDEVIFTNGTTMGINLVARSLGERWGEDDAVVVTKLDHHSNITPWLQLCEHRGVEIRWIGVRPDGTLDEKDIDAVFHDGRVRLLALTGQSNVLGTRPDLAVLAALAKKNGALVCVDAAQWAAHARINVAEIGCDFLACSGHKIYGPTGIGLLYARRELLANMPPFLTGGGMVRTVGEEGFIPAEAPARFEAGTPHLLGAIGLGAAIEWQNQWSWDDRVTHEKHVLTLLLDELRSVPGVNVLGPANGKTLADGPVNASVSGCIAFTVDGIHPHDLADVLGSKGVCVRAGHHCAQPLHKTLGIEASVRASVGIYTNDDDILALAPAIRAAQKILLR